MSATIGHIHDLPLPQPNQEARDVMSFALMLEQGLDKIKKSEPQFQAKALQNLRRNFVNTIQELNMSEERKSYFLHQLAYAREIDELHQLGQLLKH